MPQIIGDRRTNIAWQWQLGKTTSFPAHRNQSFLPVQIFQSERPDLTSAQAQTRQDQENRIVAAAHGRFSVDGSKHLLYLVGREGAWQGRLLPVRHGGYTCGQILLDVSPIAHVS